MRDFLSLWPVRLAKNIWEGYHRCAAAQSAAALSYFLILTLFPLLLCVDHLIGVFHLDLEQLLSALSGFLPPEVPGLLKEYLSHAAQRRSSALLAAALFAIAVSASAALRTLLHALDRLYGQPPRRGLRRFVGSILLALLFLAAVYLSVVVIFTGDWFFHLLGRLLPQSLAAHLPLAVLSRLWLWLRYLLLFCFMLLSVLVLYALGTPKRYHDRVMNLSALLTSTALAGCSAVFSWVIGMSSRYSLLYGSLAALIVLLVWLYLCGCVLLLGAVVGQVFRNTVNQN